MNMNPNEEPYSAVKETLDLLRRRELHDALNVDPATIKSAIEKIEKERIASGMEKLCDEIASYFALELAKRDSQSLDFQSRKMKQLKQLKQVYSKASRAQPEGTLSDFIHEIGQQISAVIDNTQLHLLPLIKQEAESLDLLRKMIPKGINIQTSFWFDPLQKFIAYLESTLEPQVYKPEFEIETFGTETITTAKIQGSFISLKDILEDDDLMSSIKFNNAKHIMIFSRHTVYIDTKDEIILRDLSLSIISPIWVVPGNGKKEIVLQGLDGAVTPDAENWNGTGKGLGGDHGSCGGSGGNFLGVGHHIVGGALDIKSMGGKGGNGQNGGSGVKGKDGDMVDVNKIHFDMNSWEQRDKTVQIPKIEIRSSPYKLKETGYGNCRVFAAIFTWGALKKYNEVFYDASAERGTSGQMGGKGGSGGRGGSKGEISINFPPDYNSFFTCTAHDGAAGSNGNDGKKGADGRRGNDAKITFRWDHKRIKLNELIPHNGVDHIPSVSDAFPPSDEVCAKIPLYSDKIIEHYRAFARTSCSNPLHRTSLSSFYIWLLYGPTTLNINHYLEEFYNLENHYQIEKNNLDFQPFYKMLMENIQRKLNSPGFENQENENEKKVLLYLYTASLTRYNSFNKNNLEPCLIIDIKSYLQLAQERIKEFKANARSEQILSMIKDTKKMFEDENKSKLNEAESFINDIITPDIIELQRALDSKVEVLLEEIKKLKSRTKLEAAELKEKRAELKKQMFFHGFFGALKVAATVVSFMGPIGLGVGAAIGAAVGVGELVAGAGGRRSKRSEEVKLPPAVTSVSKTLDNSLLQLHQEQVKAFVTKLTSIQTILKADGGISTMYTKVKGAKDEVLALASTVKSKQEIQEFDRKMKAKVNKIKGDLETEIASIKPKKQIQNQTESSNSNKIEMRVVRLQQATNVMNSGIELASKLATNEQEHDELSFAITNSKEKLQQLHQFEKKVQDEMTWMLGEMREDLEITMREMSQRSAVSLDVAKWQIKRMLEDTKLFIREQFTGGFQVEPEMSRVMDKLSEGLSTLIQVYDRMQQTQEQTRVVNFISQINSIPHTDFENSPAIQKLDGIIQGNVILQEYQLILNSLKMWTFPFAKFYLEDLQPVTQLNEGENSNLKDVITEIGANVDKLLSKVKSQKATVGSAMDVLIHKSRFDDAKSTPKPFYTWTFKEYGNVIEKFLEGTEVVLNADILGLRNSKMNAVKFNKIELALDLTVPPDEEHRNVAFDSELENYNVTLTHMGNSYYKYGHKFYNILSREIVFSFNLHSIQGAIPGTRNAVYEKMLEGDVMLSPYAMWKMKLEPVDPDRGFGNLTQLLKDNLSLGYEPDLKLLGSGTFVRDGVKEDLMLDAYYTPHYF